MTINEVLEKLNNSPCSCGRVHSTDVKDVVIGCGAIASIPQYVKKYNANKPFILADNNTYKAAGERVCSVLRETGITYSKHIIPFEKIKPDEKSVGSAFMAFDNTCDILVAVGSGVINDIGKILAGITGKPYITVATAPSMDGYASDTSSMVVNGFKVSLNSKVASVIIGDIDVLKNAPADMLKSGLGDMIAKYVSICEWQVSNIVTGEYYCEMIADIVKVAVDKCVSNAAALLSGDIAAVEAVFEGLVLSGIAMSFAKLSRPASGTEHYISHLWDMRGLSYGTPVSTHGIQCAIGTLYTLGIYEKLKDFIPDKLNAIKYAEGFDVNKLYDEISAFAGNGAEAMIALDRKEQKYDLAKHAKRLDNILANWETIIKIINGLPSACEIEELLDAIKCPKTASEICIDESIVPLTVKLSKDIRDKYVLPNLLWDLGVIDETV